MADRNPEADRGPGTAGSRGTGSKPGDRRASGFDDRPETDRARTFEELMAELEEATTRLAAGDIGIEAAADLYERAEDLHAQAAARLEQVKARVEGLTRPPGSPSA